MVVDVIGRFEWGSCNWIIVEEVSGEAEFFRSRECGLEVCALPESEPLTAGLTVTMCLKSSKGGELVKTAAIEV